MNYLAHEKFNLSPAFNQLTEHKPKVLMLYGSLRENSFSRLAAEEAGRILETMGAEVKFFNPKGLPYLITMSLRNTQRFWNLEN